MKIYILKRTAALACLSILSLAIVSGCGPINKTIATLDKAIEALQIESNDWEAVVRGIQAEVPKTIRNELTNLLNDTIAFAGAETRCNFDFAGKRVLSRLIEIRNNVADASGIARLPAEAWIGICQVIPNRIDMALSVDRRNNLEIWGYDFDQPAIDVFVETTGGSRAATQFMARTSPYLLTVNLTDANGANLGLNDDKILVKVGDKTFAEINVLQHESRTLLQHREVASNNLSCSAVCDQAGLVALSSGSSTGGQLGFQDFFLCSFPAGGSSQGQRAGVSYSSLDGKTSACLASWGADGRSESSTQFHCACGTDTEYLEWHLNSGPSCKNTCEGLNLRAVSPGMTRAGLDHAPVDNYYCAVERPDGLRSGFNLDAGSCHAPYARMEAAGQFLCACAK